jgi:hemoglobin-like flavoprotein
MTIVTPQQIALVEATLAAVSIDELSSDFYRRALARDPSLADMFPGDPIVQRERFGAELAVIVHSISRHDDFLATTRALGRRHRDYGVHAAHYALMGEALVGALAAALGTRWTPETESAWRRAYDLVAEAMLGESS